MDTIAGWSLRYSASYPAISGLVNFVPGVSREWEDVYSGTIKLLDNRAIQDVIRHSYSGVYIDEYQDCLRSQHQIVRKLANILPCRIVGDPLQSIFGFGQNQLADWATEVVTSFKIIGELDTPWRWAKTNPELGQWLKVARGKLTANEVIDLRDVPKGIQWVSASDLLDQRRTYYRMGSKKNETACIIGGWEAQCHSLARNMGGFFNSMETIECKDLVTWASELEAASGTKRAELVCNFAGECCTGVKTPFKDISKRLNGKKGKTRLIPDRVIALLELVAKEQSLGPVLPALESIKEMEGVKLFRAELYYEMCRTLTHHSSGKESSLQESALAVRERTRQFGRPMVPRTVSRTLLIKGLEFDNCLIVGADTLDRNNLYVALTRGSRSLTVISKEPFLKPRRPDAKMV